jgi:hypothetical protein
VARIRSDHARGYRATPRPERVTVGGAEKRERARGGRSDFQDAIAVGRDAVAIFRETGDHDRELVALDNLAAARTAQHASQTGTA